MRMFLHKCVIRGTNAYITLHMYYTSPISSSWWVNYFIHPPRTKLLNATVYSCAILYNARLENDFLFVRGKSPTNTLPANLRTLWQQGRHTCAIAESTTQYTSRGT